LGRFETVFIFVLLFVLSGGIFDFIFPNDINGTNVLRDQLLMLVWPLFYVGVFAAVLRHFKVYITLAYACVIPIGLALLALASTVWSIDPLISFKGGVALLACMVTSCYLAIRLHYLGLVRAVALVCAINAVLSIGVEVFSLGPVAPNAELTDAWSGLWQQKNALGGNMFVGVIFGAMGFILSRQKWQYAFCILVCGVCLVLSQSKTALFAALVGSYVCYVLSKFTTNRKLAVLSVYAAIVMSVLLYLVIKLTPEMFFGAIGKDETLTGRSDIWNLIFTLYDKSYAALGYGYCTYWVSELSPAWMIKKQLMWQVPTAHNAWIEVLLGLGILGLTAVTGAIVFVMARVIMNLRDGRQLIIAGAYVSALMVYSLSESVFMGFNSMLWILFNTCVVYATLSRHHRLLLASD